MDKEQLLNKWLSGEITPEELKTLKKTEDLSTYEKIIEKTSLLTSPEYNTNEQYKSLKKKLFHDSSKNGKIIKFKPWKIISAAAATIAVILATTFFINNSDIIVIAENGKKETFNLPDNSIVKLNSSSKVEFNKKQWKKKREVVLDGEAFFQVAHGKTFDVITNTGIVSVVGTQFNIKNRPGYYEVVCYEGIVRVKYNEITKLLTKGKSFKVLNGNVIKETDNTLNVQPDWIQNKSQFNSIPYEMVLSEFERIYNVTVNTEEVDLAYHFTGEFSHNNIEKALKTIILPLQLHYKMTNDKTVVIYAQ